MVGGLVWLWIGLSFHVPSKKVKKGVAYFVSRKLPGKTEAGTALLAGCGTSPG